jgi:hypothetical protein
MSSLTLIAHKSATWPQSFDVNMTGDGKLIAMGRDPMKAAAARLLEEGLADASTSLRLRYVDGRPEETATVEEALK